MRIERQPRIRSLQPPRSSGPLQRVAIALLLVGLFCLYSRLFEFGLSYLHVTVIAYGAALFATILVGIPAALSHRIGILFLMLLGWLVICVPFSIYSWGALRALETPFIFGFGVYFAVAGLLSNYADLRRTVHILAFSVLLLAVLTVPFGVTRDGRLSPGQGRFGNPNDFAQVLLMMLPFWWYMFRTPLSSRLRKSIALLAVAFILIMMANTGSRGALIGVIVTALIPFLYATQRQKIAMIVFGGVFVVTAGLLLPRQVQHRLLTFVALSDQASEEDTRTAREAVASTEDRWQLLKDSLWITATHPVFGVGVGQFAVAQDVLAKSRGAVRGSWLGTHNAYTQTSSEGGIPALLLYVGVLVCSVRSVRACRIPVGVRDRQLDDQMQLALALRTAIIAYAISTCFSAVAYAMFLPTLAGLAVVFERVLLLELAGPRCGSPHPARNPAPCYGGTTSGYLPPAAQPGVYRMRGSTFRR